MYPIQKLIAFLKEPQAAESYSPMSAKDFLILMIATLALIIPFGLILDTLGADQFDHLLEELLQKNKWVVAIAAIFFAPFIEEPIFRLHLDLKKSSIWWSFGLSFLMLGQFWFIVVAFWLYLFYLLYQINQGNPPRLKLVLWISAAFFALIHLGNFKDFDFAKYFYWVPFLVSFQFIVGLVLSYIRLNHGMKWAMFFHGVYNAVLILPVVYFYEPGM